MGGHACATGILAAEMAAQGVEGMRDIAGGWLPVVADKHHPERLTEGVSENDTFERWDTAESVVTKYHATVGPAAAPLDAICDLIVANDIRAEDIEEIELTVMRRAATFFCDPNPANEIAARASLPYCLAAAAVLRDPAALLGRAFRPEILTHPLVRDLAGRVRVVISEEYERRYPVQSLARVALRLRDGKQYDQERDRHLDTRYSKPTDADIKSKFRLIATPVLGSGPTDRIVNLAFALDTAPGIGEIMKCLTLPPRAAGR
jgi:2-methylcitrate dehydratase PrpD